MSDEPVNKPIPKPFDPKKILRPISSGYKLEKDVPPEVKRNFYCYSIHNEWNV